MYILILNWRDSANPRAGGAELLTTEVARRWVKAGNKVTMITERFDGSLPRETVDGVGIIRIGRWWNVQVFAAFLYLIKFKNDIDIIVDEVHWLPFFSVLYAGRKTVLLACEDAGKLFFRLFPWPIAIVGRLVEKFYFYLYRRVPTMAISQTTKSDLASEGFASKKITVLPMGLTVPRDLPVTTKEKKPTLIFLGRLHPLKGVEEAILAFALIHKKAPDWRFWIVGSGEKDYVNKLKHHANKLKLNDVVVFYGHVTEKEKFILLSRAHLLLVPSFREGWGLSVSEAAYVGTPSVAYRAGALAESIEDGKTGVFTETNTPEALAAATLRLLDDKPRYQKLARRGKIAVRSMSWEKTARAGLAFLQEVKTEAGN